MMNLAPWGVVIAGILILVISLSGQRAGLSWIALAAIIVGAAAVLWGLRWRRRLVGGSKR
jgi:membrane protein implicated in regulation of membrane protease activity